MILGLIPLVASLGTSFTFAASTHWPPKGSGDLCDSEIYCKGRLLQTIQLAEIFNDSKTFVDHYQLHDPDVTLANFNTLMQRTNNKPTRAQLAQYVAENFALEDELHPWTLPDWQENPPLLKEIEEPLFRQWANELNVIWTKLARKVNDDVARNPDRHSLIYAQNGFIIPGGRFREFYYWDSYWIIKGLLLTGMNDTARGMIDNFLSMVEKYGFVPNGGRVYYLMRSQPPMLTSMVAKYLEFTEDCAYLRKIIGILENEFAFWLQQRTVSVLKNGKSYTMARYAVSSPYPRPESYREDYLWAAMMPEGERGTFYEDLKAAAESGWDFSNRWTTSSGNGTTFSHLDIATRNIIPVELNALLERNARLLAEFHTALGNLAKAQYYRNVAMQFLAGITNVLWSEKEGVWFDYNIKRNEHNAVFYPTNLAPLYTGSYNKANVQKHALMAANYLKRNRIDSYYGGTPTSLSQTGEQWDFPNAWPPLQSFLVLGLYQTGVKEAVDLSRELAARWLRSNYQGYRETGKMFEKYDATRPGQAGGGGEYLVQEGFGWSNGVVFEFLSVFPKIKYTESAGVPLDNNNDINSADR